LIEQPKRVAYQGAQRRRSLWHSSVVGQRVAPGQDCFPFLVGSLGFLAGNLIEMADFWAQDRPFLILNGEETRYVDNWRCSSFLY